MLYAVLAAWLIAALGTAAAIRYAHGRELLDQPGERRSHEAPTPRGGGIAIVAAVLVVGIALWMGSWSGGGKPSALVATFLAGFTIVAAIGWMDDHRPLPAAGRLMVHLIAAVSFAGMFWAFTGHHGLTMLAFVAPLVLTNVWNFMDGINGIAATQAIVVAAFLSIALDGAWMVLALATASAAWAFVPYNFPRARVFMGDVGSGALGFALGCLLSIAVWRATAAEAALSSALLLALPVSAFLIDATLTLAGRILRREQWWTPHVQHAYQAAARQVGHGRVTMGFMGWTLLACTIALLARSQSDFFVAVLAVGWYTLGAILWWQLQRWAQGREAAVRSRDSA